LQQLRIVTLATVLPVRELNVHASPCWQVEAVVSSLANLALTKPQTHHLPSLDLEGVAAYIASGAVRNIVCMCGAGISVSAGIPVSHIGTRHTNRHVCCMTE